jgi:hypothetical protein
VRRIGNARFTHVYGMIRELYKLYSISSQVLFGALKFFRESPTQTVTTEQHRHYLDGLQTFDTELSFRWPDLTRFHDAKLGFIWSEQTAARKIVGFLPDSLIWSHTCGVLLLCTANVGNYAAQRSV